MRRVCRAAAHPEYKKPAATRTDSGQQLHRLFAKCIVKFRDEFRSLAQVFIRLTHC
jgi:hypothetical protein